MWSSLRLASHYIAHNKAKTFILVACLTLTALLPAATQVLIQRLQRELLSRSQATPLVLGAKGSRLDLVLHALYFHNQPSETIAFREVRRVRDSGLAMALPLLAQHTAAAAPVVGCTLDYFGFRGLQLSAGRQLAMLGECVLGADAARRLRLGPGDVLFSDAQDVFQLAGAYPLKMHVVGVFHPNASADDSAVFVDVKTAWVIEGLGHGHQDVTRVAPQSDPDRQIVLRRQDDEVVASPAIQQYNEITSDNITSFHFHGDTGDFPLTALIAAPFDEKSGVLLSGRYVGQQENVQLLQPVAVIDELLQTVFQVQRFFNALAIMLSLAMLLLVGLVVALSLRLRRREMNTMFKIGCSRWMVFRLQAAELALVALASGALTLCLAAAAAAWMEPMVRRWIL